MSTAVALAEDVPPKSTKGKRRQKTNAEGHSSKELSSRESLGGALARAAIGSLAFFFRLPIRLFRPVKLSSWTVLESFAKREKKSLTLAYVWRLLRRENRTFLVHLLGPPFLYNTLIGFSLFEAYSLTEAHLLRKHRPDLLQQANGQDAGDGDGTSKARKATWTPLWIVVVAGSVAGAAQCILSAPLDNVRLVLASRNGSLHKRRRGVSPAEARRHPTTISWRAVFRAALLPFAPEQTHQRLVRAVRNDRKHVHVGSSGQEAAETNRGLFTPEQRRIWQQRLRRLGGSVHGAGLLMSLARDSVGFASFFLIFEMSRRTAYTSSTAIDRSIAWWSAKSTLPLRGAGENSTVADYNAGDHDEIVRANAIQADLSYTASRTKSGRAIAALVLIIGGAIGAFAYEAVGRPFELMRLIIWQGRRRWQQARERQKKRARGGRSTRSLRLRGKGGSIIVAAANSSASRLESLITLRIANSAGTRIPRVHAYFNQSHPPHPLKRLGKQLRAASGDGTTQERSASGKVLQQGHRSFHQASRNRSGEAKVPSRPPSAVTLLLQHAERTSTLAYTSSSQRFRTAVPSPVLLAHTYFVAPYLSSLAPGSNGGSSEERSGGQPAGQPSDGKLSASASASSSLTTRSAAQLLNRWTNRNPVSASIALPSSLARGSSSASVGSSAGGLPLSYLPSKPSRAPGSIVAASSARSWGSGRTAWALRRLATPYSLGMLCFAWMTGDV
ncbi:unnamed protein product [Parajaminaea phylloscopi]